MIERFPLVARKGVAPVLGAGEAATGTGTGTAFESFAIQASNPLPQPSSTGGTG